MRENDNSMCTIPAGRKDGKKVKGSAFDRIIGVGDKPGEDYAALAALHQVERGKPLERLLAPEYRDTWLDLDKRFEQLQERKEKRAANAERRKHFAERREKMEKLKESATINISATSRQLIEDALLEQKAISGTDGPLGASGAGSSSSGAQVDQKLKNELVSMGFSEYDALDASQRFDDISSAIDYLCLNLDEAELPPSFAPTADVEVVQFYSKNSKQGGGRVQGKNRDFLMRSLCLSRHACEKALRLADGNVTLAISTLHNNLTHNVIADQNFKLTDPQVASLAQIDRDGERESILAIYDEDATVGIGAFPGIPGKWAAVVKLQEGLPGMRWNNPIFVAFIDLDGFYPLSAPVVLVSSDFSNPDAKNPLNASQRRLLMRAAAGQIASLRDSYSSPGEEPQPIPVAIIHGVLSFFSDASNQQLIDSATARDILKKDEPSRIDARISRATGRREATRKAEGKRRRPLGRPMPVPQQKQSAKLADMKKRRSALPARNARDEILEKVRGNQVVVVSGATGSGKTTQVPQFLLEEASETGEPISIVCTQPRRIAAISVAERVASERCEAVGEVVGYQVKLNAKRSATTRLSFCTTGVLLRKLQGDPELNGFTHVLVDEVHERSVDTDFLLLLLREIVRKRSELRVVLMSATLDADKFASYFSSAVQGRKSNPHVPVISIPGRTFPVVQLYLDDVVRYCNYKIKSGDRYSKRKGGQQYSRKYGPAPTEEDLAPKPKNTASALSQAPNALDDERHALEHPLDAQNSGADAHTSRMNMPHLDPAEIKATLAAIDESIVNVDLIDLLVRKVEEEGRRNGKQGAILIFLPGVAEISAVTKRLQGGGGSRRLWILPLHSLLSPDEQKKVFQRPPKGLTKVICATNVAETSITVEDVTVVIDTLRAKEMGYDALNRSSVLEECFISQAAAKQRAGRAGRVSGGTCYRLVKKSTFENRIAPEQKPEIQRVALEQLVLHMFSIIPESQSDNDPTKFLGKAVDPPEAQSTITAVMSLMEIGALRAKTQDRSDTRVELTALGKHLTGLPVDARIGKLLIFGSLFGCVDAALTVAATLSERSPFYAPFEKRDEAKAARLRFAWGKSDLLTYVKAYNAWRDLQESRAGYRAESSFCSDNFLSRKTLVSIGDGRRQLADALADAGFGLPGEIRSRRGWERHESVNQYGDNVRVVRAVLCAALYPNVARIDPPDTTYREAIGGTVANKHEARKLRIRSKEGERLFLHPESINFSEGDYNTRWIAYFAKVKTSRLFIRDSTMVSPYAILLFGGEIGIDHKKGQMSVDNWVIFKAPARVAVLAREVRRELDALLLAKFEDPELELSNEGKSVKDAIFRLITQES